MTQAVVFAYHNVGVRCLSVLLAHGVKVQLVVWFEPHQYSPSQVVGVFRSLQGDRAPTGSV